MNAVHIRRVIRIVYLWRLMISQKQSCLDMCVFSKHRPLAKKDLFECRLNASTEI